jgi:hypothetical protein
MQALLPEFADSRTRRDMPVREPEFTIVAQEEAKQLKACKEERKRKRLEKNETANLSKKKKRPPKSFLFKKVVIQIHFNYKHYFKIIS